MSFIQWHRITENGLWFQEENNVKNVWLGNSFPYGSHKLFFSVLKKLMMSPIYGQSALSSWMIVTVRIQLILGILLGPPHHCYLFLNDHKDTVRWHSHLLSMLFSHGVLIFSFMRWFKVKLVQSFIFQKQNYSFFIQFNI